jgi:hypothetical protein
MHVVCFFGADVPVSAGHIEYPVGFVDVNVYLCFAFGAREDQ